MSPKEQSEAVQLLSAWVEILARASSERPISKQEWALLERTARFLRLEADPAPDVPA